MLRSRCARVTAPSASSRAACSRRGQGTPQARSGKRPQENETMPRHGHARRHRRAFQRVDADRATGRQRDRARAERSGERSVLPLRIEHCDLSPESRLSEQVGLHERALAATDLAEDGHVGICHGACRVQLEGVMGKGAAGEVLADQHPARG